MMNVLTFIVFVRNVIVYTGSCCQEHDPGRDYLFGVPGQLFCRILQEQK